MQNDKKRKGSAMNIDIAQRLYELRREHGYSQESLAEALKISRQAISKWERAESAPDMGNLIALADLYGISIDELVRPGDDMTDAPEPTPKKDVTSKPSANPSAEQAAPDAEAPPQAPAAPPESPQEDSGPEKPKKSTLKIVLITILCVVLVGILTSGFLVTSCIYSGLASWDARDSWVPESSDASGNFSISASDITSISIDWLAGNVSIRSVPDDEVNGLIQVTETSGNRLPLRWRTIGSALEIDYGVLNRSGGCHAFHNDSKNLTVLIPQSRADSIDSFSLNAASGEYSLEGISSAFLSINQASGRIHVSDFKTQTAVMKLASGELEFAGDINDSLDFDQASGHSTIALETLDPAVSTLSMASGNMVLALPSSDFQLNLSKVSGNFSSDYELLSNGNVHYGNEDSLSNDQQVARIAMDMVSGHFEIKKNG